MEWYISAPSICKKIGVIQMDYPTPFYPEEQYQIQFYFLFIYYESKKGCLIFLFIILLTEYINIGKFPLNKK